MQVRTELTVLCRAGEFWIACDFCDTWYDGKCVQVIHFAQGALAVSCANSLSDEVMRCQTLLVPPRLSETPLCCVQMTPVKAQRMGRWKCPQCTGQI